MIVINKCNIVVGLFTSICIVFILSTLAEMLSNSLSESILMTTPLRMAKLYSASLNYFRIVDIVVFFVLFVFI